MTRTVTELLLTLEHTEDRGLRFEDQAISWARHVSDSKIRSVALDSLLDPAEPRHFGVLMDNVPEFSLLAGAAALSGSVVVGLNTTRRGEALADDIRVADCQIVFTEGRSAALLEGLDLEVPVIDVGSDRWKNLLEQHDSTPVTIAETTPDDLFMLIFTSGTSGKPKAVRCTHEKIVGPGMMLAERFDLSTSDVVYLAMPMFHSNAMMAGWSVALAAGTSVALRRTFSASGFLSDVRKFEVTYANYVGKPLAYVLATPERPDDADNTLRLMYGNEGSARVVAEFARRFDATVVEAFGSTEGGIAISSTPGKPPGALGLLPESVRILDPETGAVCPPAVFDADGRITNADEATGELVNVTGSGSFAGYYGNPDADSERMRDGKYWSGDLGFCDSDGFVYFAGRSAGWLRVDGENLGTAPIEHVLTRYPAFSQVSVYGVPDTDVGDRVMAAVVLSPEHARAGFDAADFSRFLRDQPDLGPKQHPTFVRVSVELPRTATFKIVTRTLSAERWNCADPVWVRERGDAEFRLLQKPAVAMSVRELPAVFPSRE
ncbi:long-chain-fatty-acid--CoA ligase [Rhodococcus sp. NPDC058521]|uniref:long-chain-fatty-acid--CoA ligase n=1 Tax=Rhodococcus sp. NPDC058521 TaxID=3346536 RepID=UPI0036544800